VFFVGLGEELWKKFLPKYLESLGASAAIVGLFGTADAIYQYPGLAGRSLGAPAGFPDFSRSGGGRLPDLSVQLCLAILLRGAGFCNGVAIDGVAGDVRDDRRRAARGTPGDGLHDSIHAEARPHGDFPADWRSDDRRAGFAAGHPALLPGRQSFIDLS